jgi:hypothetical protein
MAQFQLPSSTLFRAPKNQIILADGSSVRAFRITRNGIENEAESCDPSCEQEDNLKSSPSRRLFPDVRGWGEHWQSLSDDEIMLAQLYCIQYAICNEALKWDSSEGADSQDMPNRPSQNLRSYSWTGKRRYFESRRLEDCESQRARTMNNEKNRELSH